MVRLGGGTHTAEGEWGFTEVEHRASRGGLAMQIDGFHRVYVDNPEDGTVAYVSGEANAALFASAAEMRNVCQLLADCDPTDSMSVSALVLLAKNALPD